MILRPSGLLSEKPPLQAKLPSGGSMSRYFLLAVFVSVFEELLGGLIDRLIAKVIPGYASEITHNGVSKAIKVTVK